MSEEIPPQDTTESSDISDGNAPGYILPPLPKARKGGISGRRIFAIARKNLQVLLKDRRTFGLLIFMPVLLMVLFGYAFGRPVENIPIRVVNLDGGGTGVPLRGIEDTEFSDLGIELLQNDSRVHVTVLDASSFDKQAEIDKVYGGNDYYALIIFPADFSEEIANFSKAVTIQVYLDGSDPQTISSLHAALAEMMADVLNELSGTDEPHLSLDVIYVAGDPDLRPIDTLAPGILSFAILLFMILTVTGGFTKERISGTIYRVTTTPTTKMDIMLGYMVGNSLIAMVQCALLLIIGILLFQIHIVGNILLLFFVLFVYAMACVGIGIFASAFAQNELQAFQFIPIILIPWMFFSGFIFPLNSFPLVFKWFSVVIPMTYSINISRAIMINGFGFARFLPDFLALLGLTAVFIILAALVFRAKK